MNSTPVQTDSRAVKRYLPWVVATALFMEQLDSTIINTAVPSMAASLHVAPLSLKAVVTSYILSLAVCIPISLFAGVVPATPIMVIVFLGLTQVFFNSLQFSSMTSMAYADIKAADSSMASTIASSMQQMSMSFGLACGSLVAAWYLGDLPQSDRAAVTTALHHAFLTLGGLTMLSSFSFWTLRAEDGESVSKGRTPVAE